jgi:drug/metabolite transporter (DMT)-like permease
MAIAQPNPTRGIALMLGATLFFASMHASVRIVSLSGLHPFEIAFFRNLFGLLVVAPWFIRFGWSPLRTGKFRLHVVRAVFNAASMLLFFLALAIAPLSQVTALTFAAPIFATVFATLLLQEKVGFHRWTAIIVGFSGTLITLRPGFEAIGIGAILTIVATIGWAVVLLIVKSLGKTESSITITAYMSVLITPMVFIPALFVWQTPTFTQLAWLIAIGVLGNLGQLLMVQALQDAETHVVMPLDFFKLIWISAIAYLAFGEVPDLFTWIGGALIFASGTFITYRERLRFKRSSRSGS